MPSDYLLELGLQNTTISEFTITNVNNGHTYLFLNEYLPVVVKLLVEYSFNKLLG